VRLWRTAFFEACAKNGEPVVRRFLRSWRKKTVCLWLAAFSEAAAKNGAPQAHPMERSEKTA